MQALTELFKAIGASGVMTVLVAVINLYPKLRHVNEDK